MDEYEKELNELLEKSRKYFEKFDSVKHWEIFGGIKLATNIEIEKGFLKQSSTKFDKSILIRVFGEKGNVGSGCVTKFSQKNVFAIIDNSIKMMKASAENNLFSGLANPTKKYPDFEPEYDNSIKNLTVDDSEDLINSFLEQKKRDDRIKSVSGSISYGEGRMQIKNSNNIDVREKGTSASISIEFTMEEMKNGNKINSNGYDFQGYNKFKPLIDEKNQIYDTALEMAKKGLMKQKIKTDEYNVILSPMAVDLLICDPIGSAINAESVYHNRSFLKDKLNQQIGNAKINIIDDPLIKDGIGSSAFDGEGVPTKKLAIIEDGMLQSFLHNTYTANLFNTESTGHASRSWYSPDIGIDSSNTIVKEGDSSLEEMIEEIKNGIYFDYSFDSPNIVTGEFSGLITNGYIIKDGELGNCLDETMFGANLLELYSKVDLISKEKIRKGSSYLPYIKVNGLKLSGAD